MAVDKLDLSQYPLELFVDPLGREPGQTLAPHITPEELAIVSKASRRLFDALYQQSPRTIGGKLINPDWFVEIDPTSVPDDAHIKWVRAYDVAYTEKQIAKASPDFTAVAKLGLWKKPDNFYFVLGEIDRWQAAWPQTKRIMAENAKLEGRKVPVGLERNGPQKAVWEEVRTDRRFKGIKIVGVNPVADKVARAQGWIDVAESGRFLVLKSNNLETFYDECEGFNTARNDDQIDAISIATFMLTPYMLHRAVSTIKVKGLYT